MDDLETWKAKRRAALVAEDGWLNLTDRVDIPAGPQRVGKAADNDLQLSVGPDHLGLLTLTPDGARFQTPGGPDQPFLSTPGNFPKLRVAPLLLELHTVDGISALRVRDLTAPRHVELRYFPENPAFVIRARWERLATPEATTIGQRGGGDTEVSLTHVARFGFAGHEIALVPTHWKASQPMFVIRDATSGRETYGAARFLMGEDMTDTEITLDFNRAFTPPCGFTPFAICPLPPRQNILPFQVLAGELSP
ncbi:DUF1684 domain-containing protein [Tabrizicola oligotrophica]|uniref:DUF1684 domain-containing protein n=1 Tax=Tabrizicola oligotrophica TaxID=2710650 RepID=A0A6M0QRF1_9RHOB|nr:DUF1684 domain-containing protein [Tabrizicola oligotrophica]NEY89233.1 DUF1684 domain-containing protein [Tabrizicola oligotrophica]